MKSISYLIGSQWNQYRDFLLILTMVCIFAGCQKAEVDLGFGPNGEPRLLKFAVPGIPSDNIRIDQDQKQIIVTLPTSFTDSSVIPSLELTSNTSLDYANSTLFTHQGIDWNHWNLSPGTIRIIHTTDAPRTTIYQVIIQAAGPLAFAPYPGSRTITMEPETYQINFPIFNFRDSIANGYLQLINVSSGQTREFTVSPSQVCASQEAICLPLTIEPGFIEPGDYRIALRKTNGRQAQLDGTVSFQKGRLALAGSSTMFTLNSLDNGNLRLYGYNLYLDSQLSLQLINVAGEKFIAPLLRAYRGSVADFALPIGLKAGYYYAQLLEKNQPTSLSTRIVVADRFDDLVIYNIFLWKLDGSPVDYLLTSNAAFSTPVIVKRGQTYSIPTSIESFAQRSATFQGVGSLRVQARLTSTANPSQQYVVPAQTGSWWLFTFPVSIPLGRYRLTFQQIDANVTFDALQLEREISLE